MTLLLFVLYCLASVPNVKKTLLGVQIRRVLRHKTEPGFFLLCNPEHHKQREDKTNQKTVMRIEVGGYTVITRASNPGRTRAPGSRAFSLLNLARFAHHCTRAAVNKRGASQWFLCFYLLRSQRGVPWWKVTELEQVTG